MAIRIEFKGFINEVKKFEWGTVYEIAHSQRKQNDSGEWETVGYDYFSVVGDNGFEKGQLVSVTGNLKTKRYEKQDGSQGISLEVRASEISDPKQDSEAPF